MTELKSSFGTFELVRELGRGGMGVVWEAHDRELDRRVAIKVLGEKLADDPVVVERFKREARAMAALNHANVVQIYGIGDDDGQPYFAMEFIDGENLAQRLRRKGKLEVAEARRILFEAASGLAAAHRRGLVHRDIKPANLMITADGQVKVADFGIALGNDFSQRLTNTGEFVGTPGYLSPEVCTGQDVDQRSDIFALGIVLFEMLTGRLPFTDESPLAMMLEVVKAEIPDVREINAEVDASTEALLRKMIAKDPEERLQNADAVLEAMDAQPAPTLPGLTPPPRGEPTQPFDRSHTTLREHELAPTAAHKRQRSLWPVYAVFLLAVLGGVGWWFWSQQDDSAAQRALGRAENSSMATTTSPTRPPDAKIETSDAAIEESIQTDAVIEELSVAAEEEPERPAQLPKVGSVVDSVPEESTPAEDGGEVVQSNATAGRQSPQASADAPPTEPPAQQLESNTQPASTAESRAQTEPAETAPEPERETKVATIGPPQIAVIATGDSAIAAPLERELERALASHELIDESFFAGITQNASATGVDIPALRNALMAGGADMLVIARISFLGEQLLEYYGEQSILYSARIDLDVYGLRGNRKLGPGESIQVNFTNLTATREAENAASQLAPYVDRVLSRRPRS